MARLSLLHLRGNDDEAGRQLAKLIAEQGWTLDLMVHTHSNADHIGGNALLQKKTGCRIAATLTSIRRCCAGGASGPGAPITAQRPAAVGPVTLRASGGIM